MMEMFVDPTPKSSIMGPQTITTQAFPSSSQMINCEISKPPLQTNETTNDRDQVLTFSPRETTNRHLSPDKNSDANDFEFDIGLDDIPPSDELSIWFYQIQLR